MSEREPQMGSKFTENRSLYKEEDLKTVSPFVINETNPGFSKNVEVWLPIIQYRDGKRENGSYITDYQRQDFYSREDAEKEVERIRQVLREAGINPHDEAEVPIK